MTVQTLKELFLNDLCLIYDAEKQIAVALPKLVAAATDPALKAAFIKHLEETHEQIVRIEQTARAYQLDLKQQLCTVMQAIIRESEMMFKIVPAGALLDLALINGSQKVEHQEISSYISVANMAFALGYHEAADLLQATLEEEMGTEVKLGVLAEQEFQSLQIPLAA